MIKRIALALAFAAALCSAHLAHAQSTTQANIVATCGTPNGTYTPARPGAVTVDTTGKLCVNASVNASVSGFAPAGTFASLTASNVSADVALPAGATVAVQNTGTTTVSCNLTVGAGSAVASQNLVPASSTVYFTVGSNTHISCIDQTGSASNVVAISGGAGLGTGFGGGGGGSAITNYALETGGNLASILSALTGATPAGANLIGKVGIDQTTPGTTNGISIANIGSAAALAGNGVSGTGSLRINIASDNSAVSGLGVAATGGAAPANALYNGALQSGATGGFLKGLISCDNHVFKHITSATDTLAVQGVASQTIYVCAWRSRAAGVATWFLENTASTNANCASANTQITGVATEAANTGETWGSNFWSGLKNTSANGLCINSTGTGGVDVDIWYTQF